MIYSLVDLFGSILGHLDIETKCFNCNNQKLYFRLEDVHYVIGLPTDGKRVTSIDYGGPIFTTNYLGKDLCVHNDGKVSLDILKKEFEIVKSNLDESSEELKRYVHVYILYLLGSCFLLEKTGGNVLAHYLSLMENLDDLDTYAWGALPLFYFSLEKVARKKADFGGSSFFLIANIIYLHCI